MNDFAKDLRKVAIYARKSKITESGKSIENQIHKCLCYSELKFNTGEKDTLIYRDEGLSGFYSDRPEYLKMLRDIENNKIKAVICYKFDRISRKTIDLLNLVEHLKQKKISFISCTDDIDTSTKTGKIVMSLIASIAEFERDIIAERIADNMYELAKDGRWLGGTCPTGFSSKKNYTVFNGKKITYNSLEPITSEQKIVIEIYNIYLNTISIKKIIDWCESNNIKTKNGLKFTYQSIKSILQNPVYAIADNDTYGYFSSLNVPIFSDKENFNSTNGLMVFNKTLQTKELKNVTTSVNPMYIKKNQKKDMTDWIISVGKHNGIIKGSNWIKVQNLLLLNKNKFLRPNKRTNSLLSGLIVCPICGQPMYTKKLYKRYFKNEPRFNYTCRQKYSEKSCNSKDLNGNMIDQAIIDLFIKLLKDKLTLDNSKIIESLENNTTNNIKSEIFGTEKSIKKIKTSIKNQTENLRDVNENIKPMIINDIEDLFKEKEIQERKLESLTKVNNESLNTSNESLNEIIELFSNKPAFLNILTYEEKIFLIKSHIEKVIVFEDSIKIYLKENEAFSKCEKDNLCQQLEYSIFYTSGSIGS